MRIFATIFLATLCIAALSVQAQSFRFYETLAQMNRIDPLQNTRLRQATQIQNSNIQDEQNKVIGHVRDMILAKDGAIHSISIEFDSQHLPTEVYFSYDSKDIISYSDGYGLNMSEERIQSIYPELLANIETAAGDSSMDRYSMNTLVGAQIKKENGEKLGKVENIMFNKEGTQARGLFISMTRQGMRGETLSIPFDAVSVKPGTSIKPTLMVSNEKAQNIIDFVKAN